TGPRAVGPAGFARLHRPRGGDRGADRPPSGSGACLGGGRCHHRARPATHIRIAMAHVIVLAGKDDPRWAEIPALVEAMYAEEAAMGSPATLAPDGADRWLKGIGAGLERFGRLVLADE